MFRTRFNYLFLFSLFFLFLFSPFSIFPIRNVQAIRKSDPDPLSIIHKEIFPNQRLQDPQSQDYYRYVYKADLYPAGPGTEKISGTGKNFHFDLKDSDVKHIIRLSFSGESLTDSITVKDPDLIITSPQGQSVLIKLNRPNLYFTDLDSGRYRFRINDYGLGYSYKVDFDLVDWQLNKRIVYISNDFDLSKNSAKIFRFLKDTNQPNKILVTSNPRLFSEFGLDTLVENIPSKTNQSILEKLSLSQSTIRVLKKGGGWRSLYPTVVGDLVAVKEYGDNNQIQIVALSPDLTLLDLSVLSPVNKKIREYFRRKIQIKILKFGLATMIPLLLISCLVWRNPKKFLEYIQKAIKKISQLAHENRQKITIIIFGLLIVLASLFLTREVFRDQPGTYWGNCFNAVNQRLLSFGIDRGYLWLIGFGIVLLVIGFLVNWSNVIGWLFGIGAKAIDLLVSLFLILIILEFYNLIFDRWTKWGAWLLVLITVLANWLYLLKRSGHNIVISKRWLKGLVSWFLIVTICAPLVVLAVFYWDSGGLKREFVFKVEGARIISSPEVKLNNSAKTFLVEDNELVSSVPLSFKITPSLYFKKPTRVSATIDSKNESPVYLNMADGQKGRYLISYPQEDQYHSVFNWYDLIVWSKDKSEKKSRVKDIEEFISRLPRDRSIEIFPGAVQKNRAPVIVKEGYINLDRFYRKDLRVNNNFVNRIRPNLVAGNYSFFTYLAGNLKLVIKKHDLNRKIGRDNIYLLIYNSSGKLAGTVELKDDARILGQKGKIEVFSYSLKNLKRGVYNFKVCDYSGGDVVIDQIELNSPYFVLEKTDIPRSLTIRKMFEPRSESNFLSFSKEEYFNPYQLKIQKPGSGSDILIYPSAENISPETLEKKGKFNFTIVAVPNQLINIRKLKVDYFY